MRKKSERSFRASKLVSIKDKMGRSCWPAEWDEGISTWIESCIETKDSRKKNSESIKKHNAPVVGMGALALNSPKPGKTIFS